MIFLCTRALIVNPCLVFLFFIFFTARRLPMRSALPQQLTARLVCGVHKWHAWPTGYTCGYIINIIYTVILAILFRQLQVGYSYNTSLLFAIPSLWSFFFWNQGWCNTYVYINQLCFSWQSNYSSNMQAVPWPATFGCVFKVYFNWWMMILNVIFMLYKMIIIELHTCLFVLILGSKSLHILCYICILNICQHAFQDVSWIGIICYSVVLKLIRALH